MRECVVRVGFGTCQADEPFSVLAFPAPLARSLRTPPAITRCSKRRETSVAPVGSRVCTIRLLASGKGRTPDARNLRIFTSEWAFRHHTKLVGDV